MNRVPRSLIRAVAAGAVLLLAVAFPAYAEVRTWTDRSGNKIEAEIIAAYESSAYFIAKNGNPFHFPIGGFAPSDVEYVVKWAGDREKERLNRIPMRESTSPMTRFLLTHLVVPAQGKKGFEKLEVGERLEPEFYVFYRGANWCGPCHQFCPSLTAFYRAQMAGGDDNFEVIFLSSDNSEGEMRTYMQKMEMPWPAVRYRDAEDRIFRNYGGRYVPRLVVTDRLGRVLLHSEIGPGAEPPGAHGTLSAFNEMLNASNRHKRPPLATVNRPGGS